MPTQSNTNVLELPYDFYQDRQKEETEGHRLIERAGGIRFGNKFRFEDGQWIPLPYKGFAIVSMVNDNPGNEILSSKLADLQYQIIEKTGLQEKLYPLPSGSFHQTIANTLSAQRFQKHVIDNGLEAQYPGIIKAAIEQIPASESFSPIPMRLIGLSIFGSALGILGIFDQKSDFQRILDFRERIYRNPNLNQIDIKRTRPFIGHITLLYFGENIGPEDGQQLAKVCMDFNKEIHQHNWQFIISHTQLRHYENLAHFEKESNYPIYSFQKK